MRFTRHFILCLILAVQASGAIANQESAYNLGVRAFRIEDFRTARQHWEAAIKSNDPSALNNLGYLLYTGKGGLPDQRRAVALWRKAALLGHSEAQWHLGQAYEDGTALKQSKSHAYSWYRCAVATAMNSDEDKESEQEIANGARDSLEKLLGKLSKDQFAEGESLAKQCIANYAGSARKKLR